jgi:hypothetical protein
MQTSTEMMRILSGHVVFYQSSALVFVVMNRLLENVISFEWEILIHQRLNGPVAAADRTLIKYVRIAYGTGKDFSQSYLGPCIRLLSG